MSKRYSLRELTRQFITLRVAFVEFDLATKLDSLTRRISEEENGAAMLVDVISHRWEFTDRRHDMLRSCLTTVILGVYVIIQFFVNLYFSLTISIGTRIQIIKDRKLKNFGVLNFRKRIWQHYSLINFKNFTLW